MKHLDLFSGIGGFALAARWMNWETIQFVEIDKFCQKVLNKNFPNVPIHDDIKTYKGIRNSCTILTGGFPCKQTSVGAAIHAGRTGLEGKDSGLWYELLRVIGEVQSSYVVIENVQGVKKWQNIIQKSLEGCGYTVSILDQQASFYGLPHSRRRCIIIANRHGTRFSFARQKDEPTAEWVQGLTFNGGSWISTTPGTCGSFNGLPNRMDRIKSLGNAIVPQVAFEIFKAIEMSNHPQP